MNADDFGLTRGVNRAIEELHHDGLLSSSTLMACAGAAEDAISIARANPSLGVGCHVVLVDGDPVLPLQNAAGLVDAKTSRLHPSLMPFLRRLYSGRITEAQIEAETAAQIAVLQSRGVPLTHIDTHKHAHMFPPVLRPVLRAARAAGIRAVRNPFEPMWAIHATRGAPRIRCAQVKMLGWMEPVFRRMIDEEGFVTTDGAIAVAGTGILDADLLRSLLGNLPNGVWELVTHPGYSDADLAPIRTRLRESRNVERNALAALREFPSIQLLTFADLHPRASAPTGS